MSEQQTEEKAVELEVMPGAEAMEQPENIDLNFEVVEEANETTEPETEAEPEVEAQSDTDNTEEAVAEETTEEPTAEVEETVEEPAEETEQVAEQTETEEVVEEPPVEKPKKQMVPKSRLDQALNKQKELQRKLEEIQNKQTESEATPTPSYDFDKAEVDYQALVLDGKSQEAVALRKEIRAAEREALRQEMQEDVTQTVSANQEQAETQKLAAEIEAEFTIFDQNHKDFNESMAQEVIALRDGFIQHNHSGPEALRKAADMVIKAYDLRGPASQQAETPTLAAKKAPTKPPVDEVARKRKQVNEKLKAAEAQPPELPGESSAAHGEKPLDIDNMTEDEFNALPPATIARLRGDVL
tara:strand:+ start:11308 stop:12375 length:1068 start_codon:yes stop_codon:yes gene_type:complete